MLPVEEKLSEICTMIDLSPVCAMEASTGSGKTTKLPPGYFLHRKTRILVLEPTVVAARRSAERVRAENPAMKIGVGAGGKHEYDDTCAIVFMTFGHALILFGRDKTFRNVDIVIFDEVHTTSTELELLTALVQHQKLKTFKVVLLSATLMNHTVASWKSEYKTMPVLSLNNQIFPITESFHPKSYGFDKDDQYSLLQDTVGYLAEQNRISPPGHFLVFCSGLDVINNIYDKMFSSEYDDQFSNCFVYCAHSSMPDHELDEAFSQVAPKDNLRSIILSTDIGETSVTIPFVVLVVDMGLQKIMTCVDEVSVLKVVQVSQFAAKQRAGRTGRTGPGHVHRMYTQQSFDQLDKCYEPALSRTPLHQTVLSLVSFGYAPFKILAGRVVLQRVANCMTTLFEQSLLFTDNDKLCMSPEAREICFWPLEMHLARVLFLVNKHQDKLTRVVGTVTVVIAQVESQMSVVYISRRERNESMQEYDLRIFEHRQKFDRFEEFSCCPLNSSVLAFLCYLRETADMPRKDKIAWTVDNSLNNKTIGAISTLLERLFKEKICALDGFTASRIFEQNIIPMFQLRFTQVFSETKMDKWSCEKDPSQLYRLNTRGLGFDPQFATSQLLCIHASHSIKTDFVARIIVIYLFLRLEP